MKGGNKNIFIICLYSNVKYSKLGKQKSVKLEKQIECK